MKLHPLYNIQTAGRAAILLALETLVDARNIALDGASDSPSMAKGEGFDVAFTKLLWLLVVCCRVQKGTKLFVPISTPNALF